MFKNILSLFLLLLMPLVAQDTLSQAFKNADVESEIELFYYNIEKKESDNAYATALGGYLKYSTDTKNPLFASVRFHTSNPVGESLNREKTAMFNNDNSASSLTTLSESFLAYRTKSRVMKIGNMMLNTPMMNDDTTRVVPWSYQGFTYTGYAIKDTKVQLYYIGAIRSHTSDIYKDESASGKIGNSGITMFSLHDATIKDLKLQAYYYYAPELYSTFIAQADYEFHQNENLLYCMGIQYFKSENGGKYNNREGKNGGDDINLLALKVSIDSEDFLTSLSYSQNFGISGIVKGYGGLSKVYTSSMIANGRGNYKPETWMFKTRYNLPTTSHDSEVALYLTNTKVHDSRGDPFNAYYFHFKHYFSEESSIYLRYENIDYSNAKSDANYLRLIAKYEFK